MRCDWGRARSAGPAAWLASTSRPRRRSCFSPEHDPALLPLQNGNAAASLSVAEQYVNAFSHLAKDTNTILLPANTGDITSMVTQVSAAEPRHAGGEGGKLWERGASHPRGERASPRLGAGGFWVGVATAWLSCRRVDSQLQALGRAGHQACAAALPQARGWAFLDHRCPSEG